MHGMSQAGTRAGAWPGVPVRGDRSRRNNGCKWAAHLQAPLLFIIGNPDSQFPLPNLTYSSSKSPSLFPSPLSTAFEIVAPHSTRSAILYPYVLYIILYIHSIVYVIQYPMLSHG
ncbi:hypothetical protein M758_2G046400 [Ceratodon purpureus]|nr:hypothetical protein M758_2G046400 [Ceratodon purpureus]